MPWCLGNILLGSVTQVSSLNRVHIEPLDWGVMYPIFGCTAPLESGCNSRIH